MDGRNPFRTTLKPRLKPERLLAFTGESSFQGFLGGAGFRPSRVPRNMPGHSAELGFSARCFGWEGSATKMDYRKKGVPYSNLSTGGPSEALPSLHGDRPYTASHIQCGCVF